MESSADQEANLPDFQDLAKHARDDILPNKSKCRYNIAYEAFLKWKEENKISITSEDCLLIYFDQVIMKKYAPNSAWCYYSMLKSLIKIRENIDINKYYTLTAELRKFNKGYQPKKAETFTSDQVRFFFEEAPDETFLVHKVIMIFGLMGCCRCDEIVNMELHDIVEQGELILVNVPKNKTDKPRKFTITPELAKIVKKYKNLRPKDTPSKCRFFIRYENKKCIKANIGKSKISKVPKDVASWLGLPNSEGYTGHALRRTSAILLSNGGGTMMDVMHIRGWESDKIARGYVDKSLLNSVKIANIVSKYINPSTSKASDDPSKASDNEQDSSTNAPIDMEASTSKLDIHTAKNETLTAPSIKRIATKTNNVSHEIQKKARLESIKQEDLLPTPVVFVDQQSETKSLGTQECYNPPSTFNEFERNRMKELKSNKGFYFNNCTNVTINYNIN